MPAFDPTPGEREKIHKFYLASRELLEGGFVPAWSVQRGFDESMFGYLGDHVWRPTHVSHAAAQEIASGNHRNVQRAHGLGGRLDRHKRTMKLLTDPLQNFDDWWKFYLEHDATVLITKKEHSSEKEFELSQLIALPPHPHGMFTRAGFGFKVRKNVEVAWIVNKLKEMEEI